MDDDLKNKIIQMDAQSLNKIIQNPELYNENVVSFAKYCANIRLNPSYEENYKNKMR